MECKVLQDGSEQGDDEEETVPPGMSGMLK